jgi:hypothetical protein
MAIQTRILVAISVFFFGEFSQSGDNFFWKLSVLLKYKLEKKIAGKMKKNRHTFKTTNLKFINK